MVLRERKINNKSDNVQLQVSFGLPDVKELLKIYANLCKESRDIPQPEDWIRYWFEHDYKAFAGWPEKWRQQLSGWAFCVAVRNKLLLPTAADENKYKFADCLFVRRGRPPKEE